MLRLHQTTMRLATLTLLAAATPALAAEPTGAIRAAGGDTAVADSYIGPDRVTDRWRDSPAIERRRRRRCGHADVRAAVRRHRPGRPH